MKISFKKITVTTRDDAWAEAKKIFPVDYEKDETASANAGYTIYRNPTLNHYNKICDLGNRLEITTGELGEIVTNIWLVPEIIQGMGTNMSEEDYQKLCGECREWEITRDEAKIYINREFGFEASRIDIIYEVETYKKEGHTVKLRDKYRRTPQYCATDYNYVRFNVDNWSYEAVNGQLCQYYC